MASASYWVCSVPESMAKAWCQKDRSDSLLPGFINIILNISSPSSPVIPLHLGPGVDKVTFASLFSPEGTGGFRDTVMVLQEPTPEAQ
jgi:hypothetical protein